MKPYKPCVTATTAAPQGGAFLQAQQIAYPESKEKKRRCHEWFGAYNVRDVAVPYNYFKSTVAPLHQKNNFGLQYKAGECDILRAQGTAKEYPIK